MLEYKIVLPKDRYSNTEHVLELRKLGCTFEYTRGTCKVLTTPIIKFDSLEDLQAFQEELGPLYIYKDTITLWRYH